MANAKLIGIVLIVVGALALAYQGITFVHKEKAVDLGPIEITHDEKKTIPLPPIVGVVLVVGGVVLLASGRGRS